MDDVQGIIERLTQQQHSCLCVAKDWVAPYEVSAALYPKGSSIRQRKCVDTALKTLRDKYFLRYAAANGTYKITDKGEAYLAYANSALRSRTQGDKT